MQRTTLQVNFRLTIPTDDYLALCAGAAPAIAQVPGLHWKLFTLDEQGSAGAGIYLFADRASAEAYVAGPILGGLKDHPGITDLSIRVLDVDEQLSEITGSGRKAS